MTSAPGSVWCRANTAPVARPILGTHLQARQQIFAQRSVHPGRPRHPDAAEQLAQRFSFGPWLEQASQPDFIKNKLATALANKLARIAWSCSQLMGKAFDTLTETRSTAI